MWLHWGITKYAKTLYSLLACSSIYPPRNVSEIRGKNNTLSPMKNFNRHDSHGRHGSKRREHSHGSHAVTHALYINAVTITWCEAPAQLLVFSACWVFSCFRNPPNSDMDYMIFIVHACTHRGWAHRQRVSTIFFYCAHNGIRTFVLWIRVLRSTN